MLATSVMILVLTASGPKLPSLEAIFEMARKGKTHELQVMLKDGSIRSDRLRRTAISLALYMTEPECYQQQFVDNFPEDSEGVMEDLYENIELKQFTPEFLFSFRQLGGLARRGSNNAIEKLFRVALVSDGVVSEQLCEDVGAVISHHPKQAVLALASIDSRRDGVYSCFDVLSKIDRTSLAHRLEATTFETAVELQIRDETLSALANSKSQ